MSRLGPEFPKKDSCRLMSAAQTRRLYTILGCSRSFPARAHLLPNDYAVSQLPGWPGRSSQQLMSASNIAMVVRLGGGAHTLVRNPLTLQILPLCD